MGGGGAGGGGLAGTHVAPFHSMAQGKPRPQIRAPRPSSGASGRGSAVDSQKQMRLNLTLVPPLLSSFLLSFKSQKDTGALPTSTKLLGARTARRQFPFLSQYGGFAVAEPIERVLTAAPSCARKNCSAMLILFDHESPSETTLVTLSLHARERVPPHVAVQLSPGSPRYHPGCGGGEGGGGDGEAEGGGGEGDADGGGGGGDAEGGGDEVTRTAAGATARRTEAAARARRTEAAVTAMPREAATR